MKQGTKQFTRATLAMLGTCIGAGVFALPVAFRDMGIFAGSVAFWVCALAVLATHLLYAEVVLRNAKSASHRLPEQAGQLLGPWARWVAYFTHPAQAVLASLAYMILGGEFLSVLAHAVGLPSVVFAWQILFWVGGAATVFFGLKFVTAVESKTSWVLIGLLLVSSGFFFNASDSSLFLTARWGALPGGLGVFLFALFGWQVIPEVFVITNRSPKRTKLAVALGSLSAAFLMWLFAILAYASFGGALGSSPGQLSEAFPSAWAWLLPAVGFFAVTNPFLTLNQDLKAMLHLDARLSKPTAWAIALGMPLVLFIFISRDFLDTVGFSGSILSSINGILICLMAFTACKVSRKRAWVWCAGIPIACITLFAWVFIRRVLELVG